MKAVRIFSLSLVLSWSGSVLKILYRPVSAAGKINSSWGSHDRTSGVKFYSDATKSDVMVKGDVVQ